MSRGVKDLRQLISQTREVRVDDSSEEEQTDNDDIYSQSTAEFSKQTSSVSVSPLNSSDIHSVIGNDCNTSVKLLQHIPSADGAASRCQCLRLRCSNPRPLSDLGYHPASCQLHELPKYQPLPAVISDCCTAKSSTTARQQSAKETASIDSIDSGFITSDSPVVTDKHKTFEELDIVLQLLDTSVVLVWLEQTKRSTTDISDWCAEEENFIHFAHFWLSEFPPDRRSHMFEFEYGLLRDKIESGFKGQKPSPEQLASFLAVILHEYPEGRLSRIADSYIFLEHLEALAERHKRDSLLSALIYPLRNRQHYDCLLAVRSYAIVTICSAILDQYRSGMDFVMASSKKKSTRPNMAQGCSIKPSAKSRRPSTAKSKSSLELKFSDDDMADNVDISNNKKTFDAIRLGFEDVVQYLLETHKVSVDLRDSNNKTMIFHAVTNSQTPVLRYLLSRCQLSGYSCLVNVAADSGNTPLHAAVNRGDVATVRELVSSPNINVNVANHECGDVTPLLLAAMHGHVDIAELLLNAGADLLRTMNGKTAREIAIDFDNLDVADLIDRRTSH